MKSLFDIQLLLMISMILFGLLKKKKTTTTFSFTWNGKILFIRVAKSSCSFWVTDILLLFVSALSWMYLHRFLHEVFSNHKALQ